MRVLILPSFYPTADEPNRGVFFQEQARLCLSKDVEIHVLFYELRSLKKIKFYKNWKNRFQIKSYNENGLMVYRCHAWNIVPTQFKLGNKIWVEASFKLFEKYVKLYGVPDLIHVQSAFPAANLAYRIMQKYNVPYFINEHSSKIKLGHFSASEVKNYEIIFKEAIRIVAVSKSLKELISNKFSIPSNRIQVIPNFINTDFFSPSMAKSENVNSLTFLTVCFLEKNKRVDRLIDAFYEGFKNDKSVKLIIGGDGSERSNILQKIEAYELGDQITLTGSLLQTQVRDEMQQCDCFILPSETETFGVVLIEAMATGKPVIATRSGGPEDFVIDEVGLLAQKDVSSIAAALLEMKTNISSYDSIAIRQYVIDNFSAQSVVSKVTGLYKEISGYFSQQ
jgi:L-malate glycosyltransferase